MNFSDRLAFRFFEMIFTAVCCVYFTAFSNVYSFPSIRDASWPADMTSPFGYRTPSPIDIATCGARIVNTSCPLQIIISQYVPYETINTGYSLRLVNSCPELIYITGSIFGNTKYLFEKVEFYWAKTYTGVAGSRIDGVGYANYLSDLQEGKSPNPFFTEFGKVLSCLSKPGSNHQSYTPSYYVWYDQWFKTTRFYAYPGSIGQYDCATIVQAPRSLATYISIPQFKMFQNIRDSYGTPVSRVSPSYPANGRPVIEVCGVHQSFPII